MPSHGERYPADCADESTGTGEDFQEDPVDLVDDPATGASARTRLRGPSTTTGCEANFRARVPRFASILNCRGCNRGTRIQVLRPYPECLNVAPGPVDHQPTTCRNSIDTRTADETVNRVTYVVEWRYVTRGGEFVLVRDTNIENPANGVWVYMRKRAFRSRLCTRESTKKFDRGPVR